MDAQTPGLPSAAQSRITQQLASGVRSSLFSAPAAAAAQSGALEPVGEVFGALVMNLGYAGGGCGWWSNNGPYGRAPTGIAAMATGIAGLTPNTYPTSPIFTTGHGGRNASFVPYVAAVGRAWDGVLARMLAEAKALGAHGVVGVTVERKLLDAQTWEYTALGTAVRSTDLILAPRRQDGGGVWFTSLSAEDSASAILSGYLPNEMLLALSISTKHEDWQLRMERTSLANKEVQGMSQLIQAARDEARMILSSKATHAGSAELVITDMELAEFESPCGGGDETDFHAEATFIGTTLIPIPRFYKRPPASSLVMTVLPLSDPFAEFDPQKGQLR